MKFCFAILILGVIKSSYGAGYSYGIGINGHEYGNAVNSIKSNPGYAHQLPIATKKNPGSILPLRDHQPASNFFHHDNHNVLTNSVYKPTINPIKTGYPGYHNIYPSLLELANNHGGHNHKHSHEGLPIGGNYNEDLANYGHILHPQYNLVHVSHENNVKNKLSNGLFGVNGFNTGADDRHYHIIGAGGNDISAIGNYGGYNYNYQPGPYYNDPHANYNYGYQYIPPVHKREIKKESKA